MDSIIINFISDVFTVQDDSTLGRLMPWFAGGIIAFVAFPWVMMVLYGLYFGIFVRPKEQRAMSLSPLLTFLYFLTDEATPGFDQRLMQLFHPSLLEDKDGGLVQRGLIRAMSRCLIDRFGKVTNIPLDTVVLKRKGNDINCMALVDFENAKQVRCQLSWRRRPGVVKRYREQGGRYPARSEKESFVLNGIGIAFPYTFQVTDFHIDPKKGDAFNVLSYVHIVDFDDFGELFVHRLLQEPPAAAVTMMAESLKEKYTRDAAQRALQESVQKVIDACGGLASSLGSLDVDQTSYKAIYAPESEDADGRKSLVMSGADMHYLVKGTTRNIEVYLCLTFSGLRALIAGYELRLLPEERAQVLVDSDTGKSTIVVE